MPFPVAVPPVMEPSRKKSVSELQVAPVKAGSRKVGVLPWSTTGFSVSPSKVSEIKFCADVLEAARRKHDRAATMVTEFFRAALMP